MVKKHTNTRQRLKYLLMTTSLVALSLGYYSCKKEAPQIEISQQVVTDTIESLK